MESAVPFVVSNICALFFVAYIASSRNTLDRQRVSRKLAQDEESRKRKLGVDVQNQHPDQRIQPNDAVSVGSVGSVGTFRTGVVETSEKGSEEENGGDGDVEESGDDDDSDYSDTDTDTDGPPLIDETAFLKYQNGMADFASKLATGWPENITDPRMKTLEEEQWLATNKTMIAGLNLRHFGQVIASLAPSSRTVRASATRLLVASKNVAVYMFLQHISLILLSAAEVSILQSEAVASKVKWPDVTRRTAWCLPQIKPLFNAGIRGDAFTSDTQNVLICRLLMKTYLEDDLVPDTMLKHLIAWINRIVEECNTLWKIDDAFVQQKPFRGADIMKETLTNKFINIYDSVWAVNGHSLTPRLKVLHRKQLGTLGFDVMKGVLDILKPGLTSVDLQTWLKHNRMQHYFVSGGSDYHLTPNSNVLKCLMYCWYFKQRMRSLQNPLDLIAK